jgi:hypothetical protein
MYKVIYEEEREKILWLMKLAMDKAPKLNPSIKGHLRRWTYPPNYGGATWYDYCQGIAGRSRDSEILEESNFHTALEILGGESEDVVVVCENHWAVGWIEWIAIHKDAWDKLEIGERIRERFEDYPILDEEDFSRREWEQRTAWIEEELKYRSFSESQIVRFWELDRENDSDDEDAAYRLMNRIKKGETNENRT